MYDFLSIDFEIANNRNRASVCALGIVAVQNREIILEKNMLIKPNDTYFDPYCVQIHGITPSMVADKPSFGEVWQDLSPLFNRNLILAHNASFDMSVLRYTLDEFGIPYPFFPYNCTKNIAKKTWLGLPSYSLDTVAKHLGFTFKHHHALEDARAAATVYLEACKFNEVTTHQELLDKTQVVEGAFFTNGYSPARINSKRSYNRYQGSKIDINTLVASTTEFDESHPLYEMNCVFTGSLQSMSRKEAMQAVIDRGGTCGNGVTRMTNYLVVGDSDFIDYSSGKKTSKMKKAEQLIEKGQDLEIVSEKEFLLLM